MAGRSDAGSVGRRLALTGLAGAALGAGGGGRTRAWADDVADDLWPTISRDIFGTRVLGDGNTVVGMDAPYRAEDAAIVPLTLHILRPSVDGHAVRKLTLVVDQNPSPLVLGLELGPASGITRVSTAVRVNAYTTIHLVAETEGGALFATSRFVKAAGGCSAPAAENVAGGPPLGTLRFRQFAAQAGAQPEAQILVRHPNFSGMQMDQLTHYYIPAHYVQSIRLWQGDALLLAATTGISMSENPQLRFDYRPNGAGRVRAEALDSTGTVFRGDWPAPPAS